jgi:hypothetical protein
LEISNHANEMASISGFKVGDLMQTKWAIFNSVSPINTVSMPSIFSARMPLLTALANSSAAGPFPLNQFLGGVVGNHQLVPAYAALIRLTSNCSYRKFTRPKPLTALTAAVEAALIAQTPDLPAATGCHAIRFDLADASGQSAVSLP